MSNLMFNQITNKSDIFIPIQIKTLGLGDNSTEPQGINCKMAVSGVFLLQPIFFSKVEGFANEYLQFLPTFE